MWVIWIFGHLWKHWPDIVDTRGLLDWTGHSLVWIWEGDPMPKNLAMAIVFVNISRTSSLVEELIHLWIPIINCCGIMSTTPRLSWNDTTNIHFLFWPGSSEDLKLAIAGNRNSPTVDQIIYNARRQTIQIIETDQEEQDRAMAVTQWLPHYATLLHNLSVREWKIISKTEPSTIADMIQLNPYSTNVFSVFHDKLSRWIPLWRAFLETVQEFQNQWKPNGKGFSTPNFDRVLSAAGNFQEIIIVDNSPKQIITKASPVLVRLIDKSRRN